MAVATYLQARQYWAMLNRLYQEAYLVNPQAADAIWEEWWASDMTDYAVSWAWLQAIKEGP